MNSYLKNYTTTISSFKTISEIEKILVTNGAKGIMKEYDPEGRIKLLYFLIETSQGDIPYKLPCDYHKIRQALNNLHNEGKIKLSKNKLQSIDHSINVGWRIIKDWIYAQLSLIRIEMTSFEQIFLPYAFDPRTNKTFFEKIKENNYSLLLEAGNNE